MHLRQVKVDLSKGPHICKTTATAERRLVRITLHEDQEEYNIKPVATLGLALSGGGFRATLFHIGVIRFLQKTGRLKDVSRITSVSGGSIVAAHLALNWSRYTGKFEDFDDAVKEVIDFAAADLRGSIIRRWILAWLALFPHIGSAGRWKLTNVLRRGYNSFLKNKTLRDLPTQPQLSILSTSMTTGESWSFDRDGVKFSRDGIPKRIDVTTLDIGLAVAASSAFPPMFPPVRIDHRILRCNEMDFPFPEYLTDGGVFDNLGIEKILALQADGSPCDEIIVSDAGGNFDWAVSSSYVGLVSRNVRASDLLMRRLSVLQANQFTPDYMRRISISDEVHEDSAAGVIDKGAQRSFRKIRTDLDAFSTLEARVLVDHGFVVARSKLGVEWKVPDDIMSSAPPGLKSLIATTGQKWGDKEIDKSQLRRRRLFSSNDWVTGVTVLIGIFYIGLIASPLIVQSLRIRQLARQNAMYDRIVGTIVEPKPNSEVPARFSAAGSVTGISEGIELWLAVEKEGRIWPKVDRPVVEKNNEWTATISEEGGAGKFSIVLFVGDRDVSERIHGWFKEAERFHRYGYLEDVRGIRIIGRVSELSLKPPRFGRYHKDLPPRIDLLTCADRVIPKGVNVRVGLGGAWSEIPTFPNSGRIGVSVSNPLWPFTVIARDSASPKVELASYPYAAPTVISLPQSWSFSNYEVCIKPPAAGENSHIETTPGNTITFDITDAPP